MRHVDPLQQLRTWLQPFLDVLGDKRRYRWPELYMQGLMAPLQRKSIQPIAALVAPDDRGQVHHFVATSRWDSAPLEAVLARKAQQLLGGKGAVLIVDDTSLLKFGSHSVGVARQYSGQAGKITPCQTLVSLTLARQEVGVLVGLRLYLPPEWTDDQERCREAGVPEECRLNRSKGEIALNEIDRLLMAGVTFDVLLADAGYGKSAAFRQGLTERGLSWAVGVPNNQTVYRTSARAVLPEKPSRGRKPSRLVATEERFTVEAFLNDLPVEAWRGITWRNGSKGPLRARFTAARVRVADGVPDSRGRHLPGDEVWLIGEWRSNDERKYYLSNLPATTTLLTLARLVKQRWACEQAHREAKDELGLDHFEGRSWSGLHHHALLVMMALLFLQTLRLQRSTRGNNRLPPAPSLPVVLHSVVMLLFAAGMLCPYCGRPSG
jgi:SRSO17 transposase